MSLPIDDVLDEVVATLTENTAAVLQAPPGAGKTTRVPLALLHAPWLQHRRIVMLEPRRLAARAAAGYMARLLGEDVGKTVGYRIRFDTRVSAATRIEVVTEGVLTRMLQSDQALEQYGVVIFDEFHERSLHGDVGLALTMQVRALLRPDLRMLVMSATLDGAAIAAYLGDAPIISSEGRSFPVDTIYAPDASVTRAALHALEATDGDVLAFLPGQAEILRTLDDLTVPADTYVVPLYGNLTQAEQDRAIAPSPAGKRKIVLATSIAETSLTIEGVRAVVDSGLMRVPRFDARIGMTRLDTITVTRASADQRRGRAGRVAPGVCYRLWREQDVLLSHSKPEILEADLAPLALDLAVWGVVDPNELRWLDPPPPSAYAQARELLHELGALDETGSLTAHGRRMSELAMHPRLAHMVVRAKELGLDALATRIAELLSERLRIDRIDHPSAGLLLAFAYPDRIGKARGERGKFVLRNGRGAFLDQTHPAAGSEYIVAAELTGSGRDSRVYFAEPISEEDIRRYFGDQLEQCTTVEINSAGNVQAVVREQLGGIVLKESVARDVAPDVMARALLDDVRTRGLDSLNWSKSALQLRQRLAFLRSLDDSWPDFTADTMEAWLLPHLHGLRSRDAVMKLDLYEVLEGTLPWQLRRRLDELAPAYLTVPTGSQIFVDYSDAKAPFAAVRLQEVFGMEETPRLGGGQVPLTMQLLSPARRPVQVTRDLASFWKTGYFEVKKELKGRYPKHYWPDDPRVAEATRGVRRKPRN